MSKIWFGEESHFKIKAYMINKNGCVWVLENPPMMVESQLYSQISFLPSDIAEIHLLKLMEEDVL